MRARFRRTLGTARDRGASAVEYGLLIAAITAVVVAIVFSFGNWLDGVFTTTNQCLAAQQDAGPGFPNCPKPLDGR